MSWSRSTCCEASPSPGIADDEEGEVAGFDAGRLHGESGRPVAAGPLPDDGLDHRLAPDVGARLGPRIPGTRRPVFGIEVPAHPQNGVHGGHDRRDGKTDLEPPAEGLGQGVTGTTELDREAEAPRQPALQDRREPTVPTRPAGSVDRPAPDDALEPARRLSPDKAERNDDAEGGDKRDQEIAEDGDGRREDAEDRAIEAHAGEMNREERRDESGDPAAVDVAPRCFFRLDPLAQRDQTRVVAEPEVLHRRPAGIFLGVDRRREDIPGCPENPQGPHDGYDPRRRLLVLKRMKIATAALPSAGRTHVTSAPRGEASVP